MKTVGAYEPKTHLSRLLDKISKGERFIIAKHGTAVAVLQQPERFEKADPNTVIAEIRAFRDQRSLGDVSIRELIAASKAKIVLWERKWVCLFILQAGLHVRTLNAILFLPCWNPIRHKIHNTISSSMLIKKQRVS